MGQQQLILLVLATVIVGIAIVVGIAAFTENSAKANSDAMMQDAVRIANDMQAWKKKPAPFGGQASTAAATTDPTIVNDPANFLGATFQLLGYAATGNPATYTNLNGQFRIVPGAASSTVTGINPVEANEILVTLTGTGADNIDGDIVCLGGQNASGACTAEF